MIDMNLNKDGNVKNDDPANVKFMKTAGATFLNSLLELDVMNAGEAATSMKDTLGRVIDKLAMIAALQSLTKEGITDKPVSILIAEAETKKAKGEPEGHAAPGIN